MNNKICKKAPSEGRMASFSLLELLLLSLTHAAAGQHTTDHLMFTVLGDDVTLPCGLPSIKSCSSINWSMMGEFGSVMEVVKTGRLTPPNTFRHGLLKDCSLKINGVILNDARTYWCDSGELKSSVSLHIVEITESLTPADGTIQLQCFLNTYRGLSPWCNRGIQIKWSTGDNTPLYGKRFHFENPSECFSKLVINRKPTDHRRKWKCNLFQNETLKATITYTTAVKDGVEEVFAAVGESVSLSCHNTSSLGVGGSVEWAVGGRTVNKGPSSLVIGKVSAQHAGDYECSESAGRQKVFNRIRLQTLEVTSESAGDNLTLTCVLTCSEECDEYLGLMWAGSEKDSWQSGSVKYNNTLINRLVLPASHVASVQFTCLVISDGDVMASRKWRVVKSLQTHAWHALPIGLLICVIVGGFYMKRKQNKDSGHEESSIGMTHVYEDIQEENNEELQEPRQTNWEVATADSFYDLLQAVN